MNNIVTFGKSGKFKQDVIALGDAAMVVELYLKGI